MGHPRFSFFTRFILAFFPLLLINLVMLAQIPTQVKLPNGWSLSPAGRSFPLGDLPLNMVVSSSGKRMAVTNNGQSVHSIQLIDPKSETILSTKEIAKAWYGLAFSDDEKSLYVSGGHDNCINKYNISNDRFELVDSFMLGKPWPVRIGPAGIALDEKGDKMFVVTREDNSLYVFSLSSKKVLKKMDIGAEGYACMLSPKHDQLYISVWGGDKLLRIGTTDLNINATIEVGDNPNELCLNKKGDVLYVANANDNSVSVIDTKQMKVIETLNAALYANAPSGSTSNGLALSADEKKLYIANADNNALAVFNVEKPGESNSIGFIPVGWYPTNVKVVSRKIFVSNGKGFTSMANPMGPNPVQRKQKVGYQKSDNTKPEEVQYIGGLFKGTMSIIDEPKENEYPLLSKAVYANTPYSKEKETYAGGEEGNPIPMKVGDKSPIKYVFYIVKENRTYDQVLGDMKEGNGDPNLVLFGENITPNQHALAREFVLLDNFYVDGEVSADGHNWSLGAYATDFLEKNWPTSYGGRGGQYNSEGTRKAANNKGGFIWDQCKRNGVTYRTYGEFADDYKANIPVLEGHFCPFYTSWNQKVRDTTRVNQWIRDFESLRAQNAIPQMNTLRLINDHTEGLGVGKPTPFAHVADNDWAVGMFVEYLSKSPIWKETAIFIIEDDAQNGPDHVDAHRTTAYVAGGFVKRGYVDHTPYSTSSMLRTMELILGLPPMTQYDAAAIPMWRSFSKLPDLRPFQSIPAKIDITEKNQKLNALAKKSMKMDFTKEDRINDLEFSELLWKGIKGENSTMPAPRRSAFVKVSETDED